MTCVGIKPPPNYLATLKPHGGAVPEVCADPAGRPARFYRTAFGLRYIPSCDIGENEVMKFWPFASPSTDSVFEHKKKLHKRGQSYPVDLFEYLVYETPQIGNLA
jgi:hypothetical protein